MPYPDLSKLNQYLSTENSSNKLLANGGKNHFKKVAKHARTPMKKSKKKDKVIRIIELTIAYIT